MNAFRPAIWECQIEALEGLCCPWCSVPSDGLCVIVLLAEFTVIPPPLPHSSAQCPTHVHAHIMLIYCNGHFVHVFFARTNSPYFCSNARTHPILAAKLTHSLTCLILALIFISSSSVFCFLSCLVLFYPRFLLFFFLNFIASESHYSF